MASNQQPQISASMTLEEDFISHQTFVAEKIAKETGELKKENSMLRQNIKKAAEIAAADNKEKTALQEEVAELKSQKSELRVKSGSWNKLWMIGRNCEYLDLEAEVEEVG